MFGAIRCVCVSVCEDNNETFVSFQIYVFSNFIFSPALNWNCIVGKLWMILRKCISMEKAEVSCRGEFTMIPLFRHRYFEHSSIIHKIWYFQRCCCTAIRCRQSQCRDREIAREGDEFKQIANGEILILHESLLITLYRMKGEGE